MKTLFTIMLGVIITSIFYSAFAFANASLNPIAWTFEARAMCALIASIILVLTVCLAGLNFILSNND